MTKIRILSLYRSELASGILLMLSFAAALFVANFDPLESIYKSFVFYPVKFTHTQFTYKVSLIQIVNDGLMAFFFLLIGLELKFHMVRGEFEDKKTLILPSAAALGGIVLPALIYWTVNMNSPETLKGWAIPIATDTAFMLGVLSFFGTFITPQLRAFIIGFSLIDDAIALLILATFYSETASLMAILSCLILVGALFTLNRLHITNIFYYLFIGIFLWFAMVESGIHGTLCGVVLALAIPVEHNDQINPSFRNLENALRPIVYFLILPLFAFINSGVNFDAFSFDILGTPLALGIILGLFLGKQLGIFLFSFVTVKLKYCALPESICWSKFYAIAILSGIGFTLSLFIGDLTFETAGPNYVMRISVIIGSLLSAIVGAGLLFSFKRKTLLLRD